MVDPSFLRRRFLLAMIGWSGTVFAADGPAVAADADVASSDDDPCLLYLAQSTIPNGG
jgi:hypothetical protein